MSDDKRASSAPESGRQVEKQDKGGTQDNQKVPDSDIQGTKAGERMKREAQGSPKD